MHHQKSNLLSVLPVEKGHPVVLLLHLDHLQEQKRKKILLNRHVVVILAPILCPMSCHRATRKPLDTAQECGICYSSHTEQITCVKIIFMNRYQTESLKHLLPHWKDSNLIFLGCLFLISQVILLGSKS